MTNKFDFDNIGRLDGSEIIIIKKMKQMLV